MRKAANFQNYFLLYPRNVGGNGYSILIVAMRQWKYSVPPTRLNAFPALARPIAVA